VSNDFEDHICTPNAPAEQPPTTSEDKRGPMFALTQLITAIVLV